jgi:hypothetical protein
LTGVSRIVRAISSLNRKALLPFSHIAVEAYLRCAKPCGRSQTEFPCLEDTRSRAVRLTQGKKVHPPVHVHDAAVLCCAVLLSPPTPHYFWTFHLPSVAWSLMYSTRVYHIGLMVAPDSKHGHFLFGRDVAALINGRLKLLNPPAKRGSEGAKEQPE